MPTPSTYDTVILAGHGAEPSELTLGADDPRKALLPLDGRPMVSFVVDALRASGCMRRLVVVGLADVERELALDAGWPVTHLPNDISVVANALHAIDALDAAEPLFFCASDIPLLTAEAVRDFLQRAVASGGDLCYPIVSQAVMEGRFPGSGRSFRPTADGAYAGGGLFLVAPDVVRRNADMLLKATASRKSAWRLAALLGPRVLLAFALRTVRLASVERRVSQVMACAFRFIVSPYPELAMDVDKPKHVPVVLNALGERPRAERNDGA